MEVKMCDEDGSSFSELSNSSSYDATYSIPDEDQPVNIKEISFVITETTEDKMDEILPIKLEKGKKKASTCEKQFNNSDYSNLSNFILERNWKVATKSIMDHPHEISKEVTLRCFPGGNCKGLPLHLACAMRPLPPTSFIALLINEFPGATSRREIQWGMLPLHFACMHIKEEQKIVIESEKRSLIEQDKEEDYAIKVNRHVSLIEYLIETYPEAVQTKESFEGKLPIHLATAAYTSGPSYPQVVQTLACAYPQSLNERDNCGETPIDIATRIQKWRKYCADEQRDYVSTSRDNEEFENEIMTIMFDQALSKLVATDDKQYESDIIEESGTNQAPTKEDNQYENEVNTSIKPCQISLRDENLYDDKINEDNIAIHVPPKEENQENNVNEENVESEQNDSISMRYRSNSHKITNDSEKYVSFHICGRVPKKKGIRRKLSKMKKINPFFELSIGTMTTLFKENQNGQHDSNGEDAICWSKMIYRSYPIMNNLQPSWDSVTLQMDPTVTKDTPLKISVKNCKLNGDHEILGTLETTVDKIGIIEDFTNNSNDSCNLPITNKSMEYELEKKGQNVKRKKKKKITIVITPLSIP